VSRFCDLIADLQRSLRQRTLLSGLDELRDGHSELQP